jgi:hypothetical protein
MAIGQVDSTAVIFSIPDSLGVGMADTTASQLIIDTVPGTGQTVKISPDAITEPVDYYSRDTTWFDVESEQIHLYGDAKIIYGAQELKAGYIIFDIGKDEATAYETKASKGRVAEKVIFTDGSQDITSGKLRFNFESKKGLIEDAVTQQGEFQVLGQRTKYVSKDANPAIDYDEIFNTNSLVTTCTADHPHFGIRARKLKVVPDKLAIAGFSNLEIMGVPTPLFLPFGLFPLIQGKSSGLIFPNLWTYEERFGLGLQGVGYYFNINDYMDLQATADVFTRGTHRLTLNSRYKKRYSYAGNINIQYANLITDIPETALTQSNKSFRVSVSHNPDSKAHPYRSLGGKIDFQTNSHDRANRNDFESQANNIFGSSFNFRHSMPSTPFQFSLGFQHRQNTQTEEISVTFPTMALNMNSITPFERKGAGPERWYEKVNVRYNMAAEARATGSDSTFFSQATLDNMTTGLRQSATVQLPGRFAKYFNFNASVDYDEVWYFRTLEKEYDPTLIIDTLGIDITPDSQLVARLDTTFGTINDNFMWGFETFRDVDVTVGVNTQIFGTKQWSRGFIRGMRHTLKPSINFNYSPGTEAIYQEVVEARDAAGNPIDISYNPFQGGVYNNRLDETQMAMNYGITNIFEGKYWSKRDSSEKKFKLFNNLVVGGNYNWARDSLRMSPLNVTGNTTLLKNLTTLRLQASFDPYVYQDGKMINRTVLSEKGVPFSFNRVQANLSTTLSVGQIRDWIVGKEDAAAESDRAIAARDPRNQSGDGKALIDLFESFRISHNYNIVLQRMPENGRDTFRVQTHTIRLTGDLQLTKNWNVRIGNITYDIKNNALVYPFLTFSRDLHCWNMNFTWAPERGAYTFLVGVKSNTLSFLKYNTGQNNFGGDLR